MNIVTTNAVNGSVMECHICGKKVFIREPLNEHSIVTCSSCIVEKCIDNAVENILNRLIDRYSK